MAKRSGRPVSDAHTGFGAIAFSESTKHYGWSAKWSQQLGADKKALSYCASDAKIVARGQNTFLALAVAQRDQLALEH